MPLGKVVMALAGMLVGIACVAPGASAAGGWLPPKVVAKTPEIDELLVGRTGDGSATVVWVDRNSVWERRLNLDGTMSQAVKLAPQFSGQISLAMAPDGGGTILWVQAGEDRDVARAVHVDPDGELGPTRSVTPPGTELDAQMRGAGDGSSVVVWRTGKGAEGTVGDEILARRLSPSGVPLGSPVAIDPGAPKVAPSDGKVAVDELGNATFGWETVDVSANADPDTRYRMHERRWLAGRAAPGATRAPLEQSGLGIGPLALGAANGHSFAAWGVGDSFTQNPLEGVGLNPAGVPLSAPLELSTHSDVVRSAEVALASNGSGGVAYDTVEGQVALRRITASGGRSTLLPLPGASVSRQPHLIADPAGAMSTIYRTGADGASKRVVWRSISAAGTVSAVTNLSPLEGKIEHLGLAAGSDGNEVAGWVATSLNNNQEATITLQAPSPPACQDTTVKVQRNTAARVPLHCAGESQVIRIVSGPSHGTLGTVNQADRSVRYVPKSGYTGPESFTYLASNVAGASRTATAHITVTG
jgi:Bacterial Ig domain